MYESYFGLREKPFSIAPDPRFVYLSPAHEEALAHLMYGVNEGGGFVLLTGEVGTGKTTLLRTLLEKLPDNLDVAFIFNPRLSPSELVEAVCDELKIPRSGSGNSLKARLDLLNRHLLRSFAQGRRTVLMIDEAQALTPDVLEQIRLLTNLETTREKLLEIILVGQPELRVMLDRPELRQLSQRITARFHLDALDGVEVPRYVRHRLGVAGTREALFTTAALGQLARVSRGIPRLINEIADRSLLGAYAEERPQVSADLVRRAAKQVLGEPRRRAVSRRTLSGLAAALMFLVVAGLWWAGQSGFDWRKLSTRDAPPPVVVTVEAPQQERRGGLPDAVDTPGTGTAPDHAVVQAMPEGGLPAPTASGAEGGDEAAAESPRLEPDLGLVLSLDTRVGTAIEVRPDDLALDLWLHANSDNLSRNEALKELFLVWQLASPGNPGSCLEPGGEGGWRCDLAVGDWQTLEAIDRPVVLRLELPGSGGAFVSVTGLTRERVLLHAGGEERPFPRWAVEPFWNGGYIVLWPSPTAGGDAIRPGEMGGDGVVWVRKRLTEFLGRDIEPAGAPGVYDPRLAEAVRVFQGVSGLAATGVLDDETLFRLFVSSDAEPGPRLWRDG